MLRQTFAACKMFLVMSEECAKFVAKLPFRKFTVSDESKF